MNMRCPFCQNVYSPDYFKLHLIKFHLYDYVKNNKYDWIPCPIAGCLKFALRYKLLDHVMEMHSKV